MTASDNDLIRRGDAIALPPYDSDGDPAGQFDHHIFVKMADLRALPAVQVAIKPLEWVNVPTGYGPETYEAYASTGFYQVFTDEDSCCGAVSCEFATNQNQFGTTAARGVARVHSFTDAKAAAQADYESRILFALTAVQVVVKPSPDEHYDDYCIRQFAKLMSEKMAASRAKGRSGWHDPEQCSVEYLRTLLYEHLDKGDPVDVANFCMMLRHYEASTYRDHCNCKPAPDAAKVAALVEAFEHLLNNYLLDEHDEPELCVDDEHWSAIHDAFAALDRVKGDTK